VQRNRGFAAGLRGFGPGAGIGGGGGAITFAGSNIPKLDSGLISYLEKHQGTARFLVATPTSTYASLFILQTGKPVMALGGYQGWDKILTLSRLKRLVANGTIRFFLLNGSSSFGGPMGRVLPGGVDAGLSTVNEPLMSWVSSRCTAIPASRYSKTSKQTGSSFAGGQGGDFGARGAGQLYDCAGAA
jgi:hypothetical protein